MGTTIIKYRHDQASNQRAQHCPLTPAQAAPADDHRGDDPQFEAVGRGRVAGARKMSWSTPASPVASPPKV